MHVEFYILAWDVTSAPFFDALERAVQRGVTVRVLLDHIASLRAPGYTRTTRKLTAIGADWHLMLPVQPLRGRYQRPDLRNHRKVLVVDGRVGFMGSQNMVHRSYNKVVNRKRGLKWQDLMTRLEGPIVSGLNAIFITDWYAETDQLLVRETEPIEIAASDDDEELDCQVVPSGPGFPGENNLRLFNALLYYAQERIVITSPYFVPDDSMRYAITTAVQRGLSVELFVSEIGDQPVVYHAQRSYYEELLKAGVRIWMYRAPYILHSKHFTIDDDVGRHRIQQHGHAVVQPEHGGLADGARPRLRARDAAGRGRLPCAQPRADPRRVEPAHALEHRARQPGAADLWRAVAAGPARGRRVSRGRRRMRRGRRAPAPAPARWRGRERPAAGRGARSRPRPRRRCRAGPGRPRAR